MPIKDKSRYPDDWDQLSKRVREEAGQRCQFCPVVNHTKGYRTPEGSFVPVAERDQPLVQEVLQTLGRRLIKIVLTVHHLDGKPENNARGNLVALCQKCHLEADRELRQQGKMAIGKG